jgi:uncharacterized lipoprotein YddW (UPF0748 family)
MPSALHLSLRRTLIALAAALLALFSTSASAPLSAQDEVRALWVVRTTLTSPAAIASMVNAAKASGFNTLLVQIRGRGDAYYQNALEPRPAALAGDQAFDPLATTIASAHAVGLQVHAWVNVNLVSSATELPTARDHIIYRHPDWLMVPRALVDDLAGVEPRSPEYLGRLARHVRGRNDVEGLYVSPLSAGASDHIVAVVRDIALRYAIDGMHFDYIRYPSDDFDYSRDALASFRRSVVPDLTPEELRRNDARLADDPVYYTSLYPERWHAFRSTALTTLLSRLRQAVKTARPAARVSAAVGPNAEDASTRRLQNWGDWLRRDLLDIVCPMAYTTDATTFELQIAAARDAAEGRPVWAGIGAFHLSAEQVVENIQTARRLGAAGIILFSYDSLVEASRVPGDLDRIGRAAFVDR